MTQLDQAKIKLIDTIGRYNLKANNVAKFKFNERETELFANMMIEFSNELIEQEAKSFALWLESREFDGSPINKYWEEYQNQFN